jgi:V/A-type H+-transporting ATPase subunit F
MKSVVFITPPDVRFGFSLSGVIQHTVEPEQAEEALKAALEEPETGVVVIDERLLGKIGEERFREMERRWYGVLLTLPAPEKREAEGEDYLQRLIRRAIGYHVRLQE